MNESLTIARDMTPEDSGNLARNSLRAQKTKDGFKLMYQYAAADYVHYLNDGTKHSQKHVGFVDRVAKQVASYVNMNRNGQRENLAAANKRLAQNPPNDRRQRTLMASLKRNVRGMR